MKVLAQKNIKITFLVILLTNLHLLVKDLVYQLFFTDVKNAAYKFIEVILEKYEYYKKVMKKH